MVVGVHHHFESFAEAVLTAVGDYYVLVAPVRWVVEVLLHVSQMGEQGAVPAART